MMDTKLNNLTVKYKVTSCKEIEHYIKSILMEPVTLYHKGGNLETQLMEKLFTMYKCINIEDVYYSTKDDIALYFKQLKETLCDKSIHGKLLNHHNWTQHCSANEVLYFWSPVENRWDLYFQSCSFVCSFVRSSVRPCVRYASFFSESACSIFLIVFLKDQNR